MKMTRATDTAVDVDVDVDMDGGRRTEVLSNQQPSTKYKPSNNRKASLGPLPFSISAKFGLQHAAKMDRNKKGRHFAKTQKMAQRAAAAFSFSLAVSL